MAQDESKAVMALVRRDDNGQVYATSKLARIFDYMPDGSAEEYLQGEWNGSDIPWERGTVAAGANMAGFGTNMSKLAGQVDALCQHFGIVVDERGVWMNKP